LALAAFNVFDFDGIRSVADAAYETDNKVYIQFSSATVRYYGARVLSELISTACKNNREQIIIHLDHCTDLKLIQSCVENGWDSVMGDFSHLELNENIRYMLAMKKIIGKRSICIEGELGQVSGVEDGHGVDGGSFVHPDDVKRFVEDTGVDLLAIGIGNAHGFYNSTDGIRIELLKKVHELIPNQKLVLHGGTGIDEYKIKEMKKYGIHKINISTELKEAYMNSLHKHQMSKNKFDMIHLVHERYEKIKVLAKKRILEFK
jgi:ketose-bisphosphate aldolase